MESNQIPAMEVAANLTEVYQNSCEITTDAKGNIKLTVKAYARTLAEACQVAIEEYKRAQTQIKIQI